MNWWRAHHGISNDVKIGIAAAKIDATKAEVLGVWIILLDYASQNEQDRGNIAGLEDEEIAAMSGLSEDRARVVVESLRDRKMIQPDGRLTSWDKRQPKRERPDDDSTERVQRLRQTKRHVTPCNATQRQETPRTEESREEQSRENSSPTPPFPPKVAQMPLRGPKASWETINEAWKWYQLEYPSEVNTFIETQLFLSVVETDEDIADLTRNLPAYKLTQKWLDGFAPSSENFLSKRIFKIPPKARDSPSAAPRTKQQENADAWSRA
jgi:hypothetical protein